VMVALTQTFNGEAALAGDETPCEAAGVTGPGYSRSRSRNEAMTGTVLASLRRRRDRRSAGLADEVAVCRTGADHPPVGCSLFRVADDHGPSRSGKTIRTGAEYAKTNWEQAAIRGS